MIIGIKDSLKLVGITVVSFCAVFVCTFFLNFYIDAKNLNIALFTPEIVALYNAQLATAKLTSLISGGFLGVIAVVMLAFYIKLYIDGRLKQIAVLKAMGVKDGKIAAAFAVFGLSVLIGTALGFGAGFAIMPTVYNGMSIAKLPKIAINFHPVLLLLVFAPPAVAAVLAVTLAFLKLGRPVSELMRGKPENPAKPKTVKPNDYGFLKETCLKTLSAKKSLAFFVAFACFCFSAMVQMAASMLDLSSATMGGIILAIGVVLAVTTLIMAVTTLVNNNAQNIAVMKAFGYSLKECSLSLLGGYRIFAAIGFAVGTVYQFGLLRLMVNIVFKDVGSVPEYNFDVPVFFITLAVFVIFYEAVMMVYTYKINKIPIKTVMLEN